MPKIEDYQREYSRLSEICADLDIKFLTLTSGLVEQAAELYAQRSELKKVLDKTGTIRVHPDRPELQKTMPVAQEYRQTANCYAVVINKLAGILGRNIAETEDDDLSEYED